MADSYNPLWQDSQDPYEGLKDINLSSFNSQPPDYPAGHTQRDSPDRPSLPWYRQVYGSDIDSDSSEYWTHNLSPSQNSMWHMGPVFRCVIIKVVCIIRYVCQKLYKSLVF